jgi:release factor glutamine methyltransferase
MTLRVMLQNIRSRLLPVAGDFALPEAERLLGFLLNLSRPELYLDNRELPPDLGRSVETAVIRRLAGEPLAHVLGSAFFYHKEFLVTPDVLIPRPDTEILVEEVLKHEPAALNCRFLDIGTGSGCIAATLAEERPQWRAMAVDLTFNSLLIARKNCGPMVSLGCINLVSAIKKRPRFNFIVSNPPYIGTNELSELPPSVRDFEPRSALDGGSDGLAFYRQLAESTPPLLLRGGRIYCEIGYDQGISAPEIFKSSGWTDILVTKDLAGHDRVVRATIGGP